MHGVFTVSGLCVYISQDIGQSQPENMQQVSNIAQFLARVEAWSSDDQAPVAISRIESGESAPAQPIQASVYANDFRSVGSPIQEFLDDDLFADLFADTGDGFGTRMEPVKCPDQWVPQPSWKRRKSQFGRINSE